MIRTLTLALALAGCSVPADPTPTEPTYTFDVQPNTAPMVVTLVYRPGTAPIQTRPLVKPILGRASDGVVIWYPTAGDEFAVEIVENSGAFSVDGLPPKADLVAWQILTEGTLTNWTARESRPPERP